MKIRRALKVFELLRLGKRSGFSDETHEPHRAGVWGRGKQMKDVEEIRPGRSADLETSFYCQVRDKANLD